MRVTIVNLNVGADDLDGCRNIAAALTALGVAEAPIVHFAELRKAPGEIELGDALVLGPQGTPFAAYDREFLPWLQSFALGSPLPILAICGGMQALTLALGGSLETVDGGAQAQGTDYESRPRIQGVTPVTLQTDALQTGAWPAWLRDAAPNLAGDWREAGAQVWQSHAEQPRSIPSDLHLLASSARTPIEAWAHPTRRWLASQFHPERGWRSGDPAQGCLAGKVWMQAWLSAVDLARQAEL
jgi:GMP synthase-like glutamine amidotransferase